MKCFYHGDVDGIASAYLITKIKGGYDAEYIEADYSMTFPHDKIQPNETVYIVDFSIAPGDMTRLLEITPNVVWIDHHISAIRRYDNYPTEIRGLRYDGIAACMLTYCYLFEMTDRGEGEPKAFNVDMTEKAPCFIKLIADYDVWTFRYGDETRHFQLAISSYNLDPKDELWYLLDVDEPPILKRLIKSGKAMQEYRDSFAASYCRQKGFKVVFEGLRCFAMNIGMTNSEWFNSVKGGDYDAYISFSYDGKVWAYSITSPKPDIDVSEIAKKYGGGGHKAASGFTTKKLLFTAQENI